LTTNGVGELSAINGIAGAYSESVKVIHIVGTTPGPARERNLMIHHSLGEDPDHYVRMFSFREKSWVFVDEVAGV
jgi:pyruvate decarboxylase